MACSWLKTEHSSLISTSLICQSQQKKKKNVLLLGSIDCPLLALLSALSTPLWNFQCLSVLSTGSSPLDVFSHEQLEAQGKKKKTHKKNQQTTITDNYILKGSAGNLTSAPLQLEQHECFCRLRGKRIWSRSENCEHGEQLPPNGKRTSGRECKIVRNSANKQ